MYNSFVPLKLLHQKARSRALFESYMKVNILQKFIFILFLLGGIFTSSLSAQGTCFQTAPTVQPIQRWALVIGISQFKYSGKMEAGTQIMNLKYAEKDAKDMQNFLLTPEGGGVPIGNVKLLTNEVATKEKIIEGLSWLKQVVRPDDYFTIFISSHGIVDELGALQPRTAPLPYFVSYDSNPQNYSATAVKMGLFFDTIRSIPARRGAVFIDTCHSAGVMSGGKGVSRNASRILDAELSRIRSGIGVLVSCGKNEMSYEHLKFPNGVFTWAVLDGLRSHADRNADQIVTLSELAEYVRTKVPTGASDQGIQTPEYRAATGLDASRLPLSIVGMIRNSAPRPASQYGALVVRVPELTDVDVMVDGCAIANLAGNSQRTIRIPAGRHRLTFLKGEMKHEEDVEIPANESTYVEVNLAFTRDNVNAFVPPSPGQIGVYLVETRVPTTEAQNLLSQGIDNFNRQQFRAAKDRFKRANERSTGGFFEAIVYQGRAEQSLGEKQAAVSSFEKALRLRASDYETRTLLAEAQFNAGYNTTPIIKTLKKIADEHPRDAYSRVVLGDILFSRRDYAGGADSFVQERDQDQRGAVEYLREAIAVNPNFPPAHLILANVLMYQDPNTVLVKGEQFIKSRPLLEAVTHAERALQLFEKVSQKSVSLRRGLQHASISHIIFGGARYANDAVTAEAHYMLAKALTRLAVYDPNLPTSERSSRLETARRHLMEAQNLARHLPDKLRLVLVLNTSVLNHLHSNNLKGAIEDGRAALREIRSIKDAELVDLRIEVNLHLSQAYEARQDFCLAHTHRREAVNLYGIRLDEKERQNLNEEVANLERQCMQHGNQ